MQAAHADLERTGYHDAAPGEVELGYRKTAMLVDSLRGWTGLALSGLPLLTMRPIWPVALGLMALVGLFAGFLWQTWQRQHSRLRLTSSGVALVGGVERELAWHDLDGLRLRWFGTRRHGRGWLELELRGRGQRLVVTSALDGFDQVVSEAVRAANRRGLPLEAATRANVEALLGLPA